MEILEPREIVENVLNSKTALHAVQSVTPTQGLIDALEAAGAFASLVDRAPVFDKVTLLHALYQACRMPPYFGFNWDALKDMLRDFSWLEAKAYVLVFDDFALLNKRAPDIANTFTDVVKEVNSERLAASRPPLMLVILGRDNPKHSAECIQKP